SAHGGAPGLPSPAMPLKRMDRQEFFGKMSTLDDAGLRKALWNLYWRGTATMRERIEAELNPHSQGRRQPPARPAVAPDWVLDQARDCVALARSGAYIGGDRRVSRHERSRWRFTFQRLVAESQQALLSPDGTVAGAAALAELIDLANDTRGYDYFHSEDPVEAARFVVSDAVTVLWRRLLEEHGFAGFAERAAPQLIRWESRFGWTRTGFGALTEKECSLASVLKGMLRSPDMWIGFADSYLAARGRGDARVVVAPAGEGLAGGEAGRASAHAPGGEVASGDLLNEEDAQDLDRVP